MIVHNTSNPIRQLKRQRKVIAHDYPFFLISVWLCTCGCGTYSVTLQKADIGYVKKIFDIEYTTPLEAFIKFNKFVDECLVGKYDMLPRKEGEAFE